MHCEIPYLYSLSWPAILARVGLIFAVTVVLNREDWQTPMSHLEVVELGSALVHMIFASGIGTSTWQG